MAESTATSERQPQKPIKERTFASEGMRLTAERLIGDVKCEFEEFLEQASYLDLHLLYDVLAAHVNSTHYLDQDEATLAQAFMDALRLSSSDPEQEPQGEAEPSTGDEQRTAAPEVPEWVEETPEESRYTLVMFGTDGDGIQEIDMSRSEFETLKQHLAAHRGHGDR